MKINSIRPIILIFQIKNGSRIFFFFKKTNLKLQKEIIPIVLGKSDIFKNKLHNNRHLEAIFPNKYINICNIWTSTPSYNHSKSYNPFRVTSHHVPTKGSGLFHQKK